MAENIVADLAKEKDRLWINSSLFRDKNGNINEIMKNGLAEAVDYNKNILLNVMEPKKETDVEEYLKNLAEKSFNAEKTLYKKGGPEFEAKIQAAFDEAKKQANTALFLKQSGLGKQITNLFYTGTTADMEVGQIELLKSLAQIDVQELANNTKKSNEYLASNVIADVLNTFFINAKDEKNEAIKKANGNDQIINIFKTIYNETNIINVLSGTELTKKDLSAIVKLQLEEVKKSSDFIESKSHENRVKLLASSGKESKELTDDIIEIIGKDLIDTMYASIQSYIDTNQYNEGMVKEVLKEIISNAKTSGKLKESNKPLSFSRAGAKKGDNFTIAAYHLNIKEIGKTIASFLIKNTDTNEENFSLNNYINLSKYKSLDDLLINSLTTFNNVLKNYLTPAGWDYYKNNYLEKVIALANRDLEGSKAGATLSNIHGELNRIANTLPVLKTYNELIAQLQNMKEKNWIDNDLRNKLVKECKSKFNMKDKTDREEFEIIEKAIEKGNIKDGMNKLLERMEYKRSGYSNLNGYIGEVFLTSILKTVFPAEGATLEQRGASFNLKNQDAHVDIRYENIGIQSKMYRSNNNALYQTEINFSLDDAIRYLRTSGGNNSNAKEGDEITAFRYFLINNQVIYELELGNWTTDNLYLQALNLRISNFFRFTDGLAADDLQSISNNFYIINMNIVPASAIFLKMYELIHKVQEEKNKLFFSIVREPNFTNFKASSSDEYKMTKNNNILKNINSKASFKSFTLNLSDLGVESFLSRK